MVLFAEIRGEIERVQSVSDRIVFATDVQTFVFSEFVGSGKHAFVGSYIESVPVVSASEMTCIVSSGALNSTHSLTVRLYGSHGMLLLTVQVHRNVVQIKVLEIEGIPLPIAVASTIVDQSDHDVRGQLTGKQFIVTDIEIILRNREGLAHHAAYRILCRAAFQSLLLQRNVQSRIKYAMHVSLKLGRIVDYSKK